MLENPYIEYLEFANMLANASGEILKKAFKGPLSVETKADSSPVTQVDKEVEEKIRALIKDKFPEHKIIGEEYGVTADKSDYQWVIDPIDGTKSFISGSKSFTTLIAMLHHGKPVIGVIDQPIKRERWSAMVGQITLLNDVPLARLKNEKSMEQAYMATTSMEYFSTEQEAKFTKLRAKTASSILGGDAYAYAMLASGKLDIVLDVAMKPYDYCALPAVIEGAGGIITDWSGKPLGLNSDGSVIAASSKELHSKCLEILTNS